MYDGSDLPPKSWDEREALWMHWLELSPSRRFMRVDLGNNISFDLIFLDTYARRWTAPGESMTCFSAMLQLD